MSENIPSNAQPVGNHCLSARRSPGSRENKGDPRSASSSLQAGS